MEFKEAYLGLTEEDWNEILDRATAAQLKTLQWLLDQKKLINKEGEDD